ncbi:hypothetical protein ACWDXD_24690 [Streptomyces sp. NPDC003314]
MSTAPWNAVTASATLGAAAVAGALADGFAAVSPLELLQPLTAATVTARTMPPAAVPH